MRLLLALLCTLFLAGCNDNARAATRNIAVLGEHLAASLDPETAAIGEVIRVEATAVADNYDAMLFGLWHSRSVASVDITALQTDLQRALQDNLDLANKLDEETKAKIAVGTWMKTLIGIALTGTGAGAAGAGWWILRSRRQLRTVVGALVQFGLDMTKAETDTQAEKVKTDHAKLQDDLGIRHLVKPVLEKAKKPAKVGSHA